MVSYTLLCSGFSHSGGDHGCGPGVDVAIRPIAPHFATAPTSVVLTRRELGRSDTLVTATTTTNNLSMADIVVMSHNRAFGSDQTFVTIEAHTGRSLFHSHSEQTTSVDNYWSDGARFLSAAGKHFKGSTGNPSPLTLTPTPQALTLSVNVIL